MDVLDQEPDLRRPASARAMSELVAHERTRQDARLAALRRLCGEAETLFVDDGKRALGLGARIRSKLARKKKPRASTEDDLRARYENAQVRARRAAVFAETLGGLEGEIAGEVARLGALLVDLAHDETALDALRGQLRTAAEEADVGRASEKDAVRERALEVRADRARGRVDALEAQRTALRDAEDRLLGLVEGERMLAARLAFLRTEVERSARDASRRLDEVADALRTLVTSEDAARVTRELEVALEKLFGSLNESARLARDARAAVAESERRRGA